MDNEQWGEIIEGLAISISPGKVSYNAGDEVELNIALKNFSDNPVPIVIRSPWIDYSYAVSFNHRQLAQTEYALQMMDSATEGRRATRDLMPGEMLQEQFALSQAYDMTRSGFYRVSISRLIYKQGKLDEYVTVVSNAITIQLIDG